MLATRIIPCLLLKNQGLVKTVKFSDPKYVGDPINAVRVFNEKEVDELIFLDISATIDRRGPSLEFLGDIGSECFMPVCYGGGVRTLEDVERVIAVGAEKVALNSAAIENPALIQQAAKRVGSQSVVVSIDSHRRLLGRHEVMSHSGTRRTGLDPVTCARRAEACGAGEILLNSIDRDGTLQGYDLELIEKVAAAVDIPVVACGGAGNMADFAAAVRAGASAVAAGSMFVFHGKHRAVLISYPPISALENALGLPDRVHANE